MGKQTQYISHKQKMAEWLTIFSTVIGYIYTVAWSMSFWFQSIEVWKLKSAEGLSINFLYMNFVGFYFYTAYNIYGYFYPSSNYHGETHLEDVIFACHALLWVSIQLVQYSYYPRGTNKINWYWLGFTVLTVIATVSVGVGLGGENNVFYWMGIGKVIITFVKYVPQVWLNFIRKSTYGWSITNILLDFTGGSLSFFQIFLDWINTGNTSAFGDGLNVAKFLLSIISIFFDVIFMLQHYCLYGGAKKDRKTEESLTSPINAGQVSDEEANASLKDHRKD